jgi:hypothetical protein
MFRVKIARSLTADKIRMFYPCQGPSRSLTDGCFPAFIQYGFYESNVESL